jgi:hypothetical protein
VGAEAILFEPREAIRTPGRGFLEGLGGGRTAVQYPRAGAMIDYYLATAPQGEITMEIMEGAGKVVRRFSSAAPAGATERRAAAPAEGGGGDDEEGGGFQQRVPPVRLDKTPGMHRFTWDLRYPGPWQSKERPEGPNGPMAVPGRYSVRLTSGKWTSTVPLMLAEDPRVTRAGVTTADLREQFEHNLKTRDLVSDVNKAVARVRAAQRGGAVSGDKLPKVNEVASRLITPPIRYSKPELQTHITYLYGMTNLTDQKIGRDAIERYAVLRRDLDVYLAELNRILGKE